MASYTRLNMSVDKTFERSDPFRIDRYILLHHLRHFNLRRCHCGRWLLLAPDQQKYNPGYGKQPNEHQFSPQDTDNAKKTF